MSQTEVMMKQVVTVAECWRQDGMVGVLTLDEYAMLWVTMRAEEFRMEVTV